MTDTGTTVALLGTGTMGDPMGRQLLGAGLAVRAWNRTAARAQPLADAGATLCGDPAEAAGGADVLLTMLYDLDAVQEAAGPALAALPAGAVWLQMSTVGVEGTRRLARLAEEHRVAFVDAPVLGTRAPAEQGSITVLASSPDEVRERCAQVFDAVGTRTMWLSGEAAATKLKLVVNSWVLAMIEGIAEAVALAEGAGLDPQLFLDAVKDAPTGSPYVQVKGAMMIRRDFPPSFALDGAHKDAGLVLDLAREAGIDMALTEAARGHLAIAIEEGHGAEDMAATYFAHRAG